jgi:hypothetical protein
MMRHHLKTEYRQYKGDEDMAYITVNNKNNTSNKTPPTEYSSWLDFWEENKGKKAVRLITSILICCHKALWHNSSYGNLNHNLLWK